MAGEGFEVEEWDADFLEKLVEAEESAISNSAISATQAHHPPPPPPPPHFPPVTTFPYRNSDIISYSPPRELSQRVHDPPPPSGSFFPVPSISLLDYTTDPRELEIDKLKRELGRVSKQLSLLEEECIELKKEREKKEDLLKPVSLTNEVNAAGVCLTNTNLDGLHANRGIPKECQKGNIVNELLGSRAKVALGASGSKEVGVQTDKVEQSDKSCIEKSSSVSSHIQKQLLEVWRPFNGSNLGRDLVSKLLATCEVDLQVLFGYINLSLPLDKKIGRWSFDKNHVPFENHLQASKAAKISHLFSTLAKISNETARLEDLLHSLVSLCQLEDGVVLHQSLHVLHVVLKHAFSIQTKFTIRDNIMVIRPSAEETPFDVRESESSDNESLHFSIVHKKFYKGLSKQGAELLNLTRKSFARYQDVSLSYFDWPSIFVLMCEIIKREDVQESVRLEAVSIMNIITVSCNAYSERDKLASDLVFKVISRLLRREAGIPVRQQGINLLYQLLNCPKVTAVFSSGYQEGGENSVPMEIDAKLKSTFEEFGAIMEGLGDCVMCNEHTVEELKLRKSAITLLAFLASLGTGLAIMIHHRLQKGCSILACLLQGLVLDVDLEASGSTQTFHAFKERSLLLREALILLNRIASHPQYAKDVLEVLTSRNEVASLTIDIANRLSRKSKCLWQDDNITRQIRESEITELARVFKRRIYSYVNDKIS